MNAGAVPGLLKLINTTTLPLNAEKAILCLYNIAYIESNRKLLLRENIISPLAKWAEHCIQTIQTEKRGTINKNDVNQLNRIAFNTRLIRQISHIIATLSLGFDDKFGKFFVPLQLVRTLSNVLNEFQHDANVTKHVCIALTNALRENDSRRIQRVEAVAKSGCCSTLVNLLWNLDAVVVEAAMQVIVSITCENYRNNEYLLDCGLLPRFVTLMESATPEIVGNICNAIANIAKGSQDQIRKLVNAHVIAMLSEVLRQGTFENKMRAANAFASISSAGMKQLELIVEQGALEALCHGLEAQYPDMNFVYVKLCVVEEILRKRKQMRKSIQKWLVILRTCGGML